MNSEYDIYINPQGKWCYRFQKRFDSYAEILGAEYHIIRADAPEWADVDRKNAILKSELSE